MLARMRNDRNAARIAEAWTAPEKADAHAKAMLRGVARARQPLAMHCRHRFLVAILRSAPECDNRRPVPDKAIAQEVENFERPHPAAHLRVPAHRVSQARVALKIGPPDRAGPTLQHQFRELEPEQHAPWRHVAR